MDTSPTTETGKHRWRGWVAITLIVIGCVLAVPAGALAWTDRELTDTDAYVESVAPLIDDATIQRAFTDKITNAIFDQVDLEKFVDAGVDALEEAGVSSRVANVADGLAEPLEGAIRGFVDREVAKAIASNWAARLWDEINAVAHSELAAALAGDETRTLRIRGDDLIANTGELSRRVKERLVDRGLSIANLLPTIDTNITLLSSPQISEAQDRYQEITFLGSLLPWLVAALIIGGIALAVDRRFALVVAGVGIAIAMVVLAIGVAITKTAIVNAIPANILPEGAAMNAITIVLHSIWRPIWFLCALGLAAALAAFLAGPAPLARRIREGTTSGLTSVRTAMARQNWHVRPVDAWVQRAKLPLVVTAFAIAVLTLLLWNSPTWGVVVGVSITTALIVLVIAFFAIPEPAGNKNE